MPSIDLAFWGCVFPFDPNFLNHRYIWDAQRHSNVHYELHIILHGSCVVEVAEDTLTLSAGDMLIVAPGVYHAARAGDGPDADQLPAQQLIDS